MQQFRSSRGAIIAWRQAAPANVAATVKRRRAQQVETRGSTDHSEIWSGLGTGGLPVNINLTQITATGALGTVRLLSTVAPRRQYSVRTRGMHARVQGLPQTGVSLNFTLSQIAAATALGNLTVSAKSGGFQLMRGGFRNPAQSIISGDF